MVKWSAARSKKELISARPAAQPGSGGLARALLYRSVPMDRAELILNKV